MFNVFGIQSAFKFSIPDTDWRSHSRELPALYHQYNMLRNTPREGVTHMVEDLWNPYIPSVGNMPIAMRELDSLEGAS